jgi:hypothetical protein
MHRFRFEVDGQDLFKNFKARIEAGLDGVLTQESAAEGVNSAYRRCFEGTEMVGPLFRFAVRGSASKTARDFSANAPAHLSGRPLRKRDGDDLSDLGTIHFKVRQVTFREHVRFAAPRSGREYDRDFSHGHGLALLVG